MEVERLIEAAKNNRQGDRDAMMILIAFRHGLRASELVIFVGSRQTLIRRSCTFIGSRTAHRRRIRLRGENSGRCANFSAKAAKARSCS